MNACRQCTREVNGELLFSATNPQWLMVELQHIVLPGLSQTQNGGWKLRVKSQESVKMACETLFFLIAAPTII